MIWTLFRWPKDVHNEGWEGVPLHLLLPGSLRVAAQVLSGHHAVPGARSAATIMSIFCRSEMGGEREERPFKDQSVGLVMCFQLKEDKNVFSVSAQSKSRERRRVANGETAAETFRPIRSLATSSRARSALS